jgi:hypothetical protein
MTTWGDFTPYASLSIISANRSSHTSIVPVAPEPEE